MIKNTKSVKIHIKGMHCKKCVEKIENKLGIIEGILKIRVNLATDSADITFEPGKVSLKEIIKNVEKQGYNVYETPKQKKDQSFIKGIGFGLIPHVGCIAFLIASILGATFFTNLFKPLLMSKFFFEFLIGLSLVFATISSLVYLKRNALLSKNGIIKKWKYLFTMYFSTISVNVLLFLFIFPLTANLASAQKTDFDEDYQEYSFAQISVDIPCSGHAPLIIDELQKDSRIRNVKFIFPNKFDLEYLNTVSDLNDLFLTEVFEQYPATIISQKVSSSTSVEDQNSYQKGAAGTCGNTACQNSYCTGQGSCGGSCSQY